MPLYSEQRPIRVTIVGGGISGIAQAIRIKERLGNKAKITVLEKAGSAGGIWRDSKWPGAADGLYGFMPICIGSQGVDVPIHLYSLYSDLKHDWTKLYAEQPEVLAYWLGLIEKHSLNDSFSYNSEFVGSTWSHSSQSHTLEVRDTQSKQIWSFETDVLIGANGPLSTPLIPKIPGLDKFKGHYFHNLRWDEGYGFEGKKIAVVGSGSSAIQFIPGLAALPGAHLTQFIRSGGYFVPKINTPYSHLVQLAFRWIPGFQRLYRFNLFLESNDRWRARNEEAVRPTPTETSLIKYLADTAPAKYFEVLKPDYPFGCKRPAFDHGWLKSLHRENVELVNSHIVEFDERGIKTQDGRYFEADVVIFATGSNVAEHGVGINLGVKGEEGKTLNEYWKEIGGPQAYLGVAVPGYPNLFNVIGPNAIAGSWGYTIGTMTEFISRLVSTLVENDLTSLQPTITAFRAHNLEMRSKLATSTMNSQLCSNWWRVGGKGLITVPNWQTGFGLAASVRKIKWDDWVAVERISPVEAADAKQAIGEVRPVDVKKRFWFKTARKSVEVGVILTAVVAVLRSQGWSDKLFDAARALFVRA
ncbi:BZ3500_MvSof-1268-A1-R1_Chr7-2g09495 [Microbotryum saponariae]|uniref:BZ3500_MvSof-1268-A1-R1_Chr7-2g09495 protein n=1 Tax=Microbotryum saponariae TaxID=289078 RepID=A0A2X0L4H0_9BASI|nr:BZ3501_MvSof-1269-A2-R1_Chr7-1g09195 [Microbotryum saponariae]SDA02561.1 BZ3500_MvSof-1268-A1-R1_Chr7-2g09495 [Microbotryum saponariae]